MGTTRTRIAALAGVMGLALASTGMLTGCDDGEANGMLGAAIGEGRLAAGAVEVPSMDELRTALSLDDAQVTALSPALETWRSAVAERQATREAHRASREARRAEHRASRRAECPPDGAGGAGRPDRMRARIHADQEPPTMTFVAASGRVLEPAQMVSLVGLLEARREQVRDAHMAPRGARTGRGRHGSGPGMGMGPGMGPGAGPGMGPGFGGPALGGVMRVVVHELGADRATVDAIHDVLREQHDATRPLWDGYREGTVSAEALRDGIGAARRAVESTLETHFDADQLATIASVEAEARTRMAERQLERIDDRQDRHAAFLADALDLSAAQATAVTNAIEAATPRLREAIQAGGAGTIELEEVLYRTLVVRAETADAVRAQLTDDQAQVFDALKELMPRY